MPSIEELSALIAEHADVEARIKEPAFSSLLGPEVQAERQAEHEQLSEDLELLDWLLATTPDSPDVSVLTSSLISRMRQRIDRDGRLLARVAAMQSPRA